MKKIKRLIALMGVFVFISSSVLTVGATDSNKTQDIKEIEAALKEMISCLCCYAKFTSSP